MSGRRLVVMPLVGLLNIVCPQSYLISPVALFRAAAYIGPLLFITYINELADLFSDYNVIVKLFADDLKLYAEISADIETTHFHHHHQSSSSSSPSRAEQLG